MDNSADILDYHITIAKAVHAMFPTGLEIIVHDLRQPESSIIAIFNSHITGRNVGDGTSDIGYKRLNNEVEDLLNYHNTTPDGKPLKSLSQAIRNKKGELIGAFSMNLDLSTFQALQGYLNHFLNPTKLDDTLKGEQFFFLESQDSIRNVIDAYLKHNNLHLSALKRDDKRDIVDYLNTKGIFKVKAGISTVSSILGLSRSTIYRYIQ